MAWQFLDTIHLAVIILMNKFKSTLNYNKKPHNFNFVLCGFKINNEKTSRTKTDYSELWIDNSFQRSNNTFVQ